MCNADSEWLGISNLNEGWVSFERNRFQGKVNAPLNIGKMGSSATPGGRRLTLSKVTLLVGYFAKCFLGLCFLLVKEAVVDCWKNALGI